MKSLILPKNQSLLQGIIHIGLFILMLNVPVYGNSSADAKRVARLMREIQARVTSLGRDEVAWPACLNGTPAPLYPSDTFYDGETDDPARMAELVNAVRSAYFLPPFGVPMHRFFLVVGDLEGQSSTSTTYTDADGFSMPEAATSETWTSVLSAYEANVVKLKYYTKSIFYGTPAGYTCLGEAHFQSWPGSGDPFEWVVQEARKNCIPPYDIVQDPPVSTFQSASMSDIQTGAFYYISAANYKVQAPSASKVIIYAKLDRTYETDDGSSAIPPIPDDGKYHKAIEIEAGQDFEGPLWPMDISVSLSNTNGAEANWFVGTPVGVAEIQVPQADDLITCCGNCASCEPGTMTASLNSLHVIISLGSQGLDKTAGYLQLSAQSLLPRLATPAALVARINPLVQVSRDTEGILEHITTASTIIDIVVISASKYEIRFSHLQGSPFKVITVENPGDDASKLRFTESTNNKITEFSQNISSSTWKMSQGSGLRSELLEVAWNEAGTERTETRSILNQDNTPCKKIRATYHNFPWGMEKVSEVSDPDGVALIETWAFYDNPAQDGGAYGRLKLHTTATGSWKRFEYLANGKLGREIRQHLDAASGSGDAENIVTTYSYAGDNTQTLAVETLDGQEIGRHYTTDVGGGGIAEAQSTVAGAGADDPTNLVTTTWRIASGDFAGKTSKVINPDGTMSLYQYEALVGGGIRITESKGGGSRGQIVSGIRIVTEKNSQGGQTSQTTTDIASGILTLSAQTQSSDANGRPTSILYSDGTSESIQYDCCGIASFTNRDGVQTTYTHDDLGRVSTESVFGITKIYEYDAAGHILSVTRRGSDDTDVTTERSRFDLAGRKYQTFDGENRSTTYAESFNGQGQLVRTTTISGGESMTEVFHRDGNRLASSGNATYARQYVYSANKVREILVGNSGSTTQWIDTIADLAGRTVRREYADGAMEQSFYNSLGQLIRRVDPDGVATLFSYDSEGQITEQALDADGSGTISVGDRRTKVETSVVSGPLLRTITQEGSGGGYVTGSVVDASPNGHYRKETRYGLETVTEITLGAGGDYTEEITHPDGSVTVNQYEQGRLVSSATPAGTTTLAYDAHGRPASRTDGRVNTVTAYTYNAADQVTQVNAGGMITEYTYNALGQIASETLPGSGHTITRTYLPTGEVTSEGGTATYPVSYTYDPQGRRTSMTTSSGTTTWSHHPQRGWLTGKTDAASQTVSYTYTAAGRLASRAWARGITTSYAYNDAGELASTSYSDGTPSLAFDYDARGKLAGVTDASGTRTLTYNAAGQLTSENVSGGLAGGLGITIGYDGLLRRNSSAAQRGGNTLVSAGYSYDGASRLAGVTSGAQSAAYSYLANSGLVGQIAFDQGGTAMTTTKSYDSLDRLSAISSAPAAGSAVSYAYQYNNAGQRSQVTHGDGTYWAYGYNSRGEVIGGGKKNSGDTDLNGYQFGYAFDAIGNRTSATDNGRASAYTSNSLNQYEARTVPGYVNVIGEANPSTTVTVNGQSVARQEKFYHKELSVDNSNGAVHLTTEVVGTLGSDTAARSGKIFVPATPEAYSHDADGNLLNDGRWHYTWDGENRLIAQEITAGAVAGGAPKQRLSFAYDFMGRRISKKVERKWNGSAYQDSYTMLFVWDGWNMVAEVLAGGPKIRTYVWGNDLSNTPQGAGGIGGLLFINQYPENKSYSVGYDGNGNVTGLFDMGASGARVAYYEYGPFGEPLVVTGAYAGINPIRWSTKYQDHESGLSYYGFRYYMPETGRWLSRDPLGDEVFFSQYTANKTRQATDRLREESRRPAYLFVGNDCLNKLDFLGLAYFSYRPLVGAMGWLGVWGDKPGSADDKLNTVIGHEQLFFEDGKEPSNIGFFDDGTLQTEADTSKYRKTHDSGWNDCVMRKAVKGVPFQTYCLLGMPGPTDKFNCQDWAEAARKEYRRLIKDKKVLDECCPTEEEKKK